MNKAKWSGSVRDFRQLVQPERIDLLIAEMRGVRRVRQPARLAGEEGSWRRSLPQFAEVLKDVNNDDLQLFLEYNPYQTTSRADAVLVGSKNGRPVLLVVELKQWSTPAWNHETQRVDRIYNSSSEDEHPYRQAERYAGFIRNYTAGFDTEEADVRAIAYLHNASAEAIQDLRSAGDDESSYTFGGDPASRVRLVGLISGMFDQGDASGVAASLRYAELKFSPRLMETAAGIFSNPRDFPLSDEQENIVHKIERIVQATRAPTADRSESITVIKGKPGSGKTWICLHLLANAARGQYQAAFATNSTSLRDSIKKTARRSELGETLDGMILSARGLWDLSNISSRYDLIVVDEAQRIEEYTVRTGNANRRDIQQRLEAENITQLFELKKQAKNLVLMIDEAQQATAKDFLTVEDAREIASRTGASFEVLELTEQHRAAGSKTYEEWVDSFLDGTGQIWEGDPNFTLEIADSPELMEEMLAQGPLEQSRILAGFCWPWSSKEIQSSVSNVDELPFDIEIGDWQKRWNLRRKIGRYPSDKQWASVPEGAEQVGSVFVSQGFEFEQCGVIIGPDLILDPASGRPTPNPSESEYNMLTRAIRRDPRLESRILNQYRVLLTRAMKRTVVYATDPDLRAFLRGLVR